MPLSATNSWQPTQCQTGLGTKESNNGNIFKHHSVRGVLALVNSLAHTQTYRLVSHSGFVSE